MASSATKKYDAQITQFDTWPPLRGSARDELGLMDLAAAEKIEVLLRSGEVLRTGEVQVIDPPIPAVDEHGAPILDEHGDQVQWNWQYVLAAGDTDVVGIYSTPLRITWDSTTTPPRVQMVPNDKPPTLQVRASVAGA